MNTNQFNIQYIMKSILKIFGSIILLFIVIFSINKIISNKLEAKINEKIKHINTTYNEPQNIEIDCERELNFDGNSLCFPKIYGWKECRIDTNLKADINLLELNNKILAFYIPNEIYEKSKVENIINYPVISLFVHPNTIGMQTTEEALPMVFEGLKNSFEVQDWIYIENLLKTKTRAEFINPILFDSYDISNNVKTCVTINSSKLDSKVIQRVSFINVLDLKNRIMFLNYSIELNKDFQFSKMKILNEQIVKKFVEVN